MADPDPATAFDPEEILRLFKRGAATGAPINFAFGMSQKPEDIALAMSLIKQTGALKPVVKAFPKVGKICWGTLTIDGKRVLLQPAKPIPRMTKVLQKRLKAEGLQLWKAVLVDESGREMDDESIPEPEDEAPEAEAPAAPEAAEVAADPPELAALKSRLALLLRALSKLPAELSAKLAQACKLVAKQIADGQTEAATKSLAQVEAAVLRAASAGSKAGAGDAGSDTGSAAPVEPAAAHAEPPSSGVPDPGAGKADAALARLKDLLARLLSDLRTLPEGAARKALASGARDVAGLIAGGDAAGAARALQKLQAALEAARNAPAPEAAPVSAPDTAAQQAAAPAAGQQAPPGEAADPRDYAGAAKLWSASLARMQSEMQKLQDAVIATLSPDPRFAPALAEARGLTARLEPFEDSLAGALDALADAGSPAERERLRASARNLLAMLSRRLDSRFFDELDSGNGFAKVTVTATGRAALGRIAGVLA